MSFGRPLPARGNCAARPPVRVFSLAVAGGTMGTHPAPSGCEEDAMSRRAPRTLAMALLALATGAGLTAVLASDADSAARGAVTYRIYCSNCHGAAAKGDGRLAKSLVRKPADLTQLARKNAGVYPADEVREYIDGRKDVAEHGERDMPVWGESFQKGEGKDAEKAAAAKLDDLVAYLASIQAPVEKKKSD